MGWSGPASQGSALGPGLQEMRGAPFGEVEGEESHPDQGTLHVRRPYPNLPQPLKIHDFLAGGWGNGENVV